MESTGISLLFDSSLPLQIIRLRNARWVLPFLYQVFKTETIFSIREQNLVLLLAQELGSQTENADDYQEAKIEFGEPDENRARKYLLLWVQKRILQDFPDAEGHTHYQLSAHTEKVFQWLQSLEKKQFVGTESRFRFLFQTLREIVEFTQDDASKRLEELKNKRAEVDHEIQRLEYGLRPEVYTNAQVQERIDLFTRQGYELLSDFREVEDNFRQIHRSIVEQHTRAEVNKGVILGHAFEAYDALRQSDQGKSFYAFWDFLISRSGQEEWRQLTEQLLALLEERQIEVDKTFLQTIKSLLLQHGRNVYESNDRMAEKLSRIITEKEVAHHRRLRQELGAIKELVLALKENDDVPVCLEVTASPEIRLVMERKLNLTVKTATTTLAQPEVADEVIEDEERFRRLLQNKSIDKKRLWAQVEQVLAERQTATLGEVITQTGLQQGLAEVVSYFDFLRDNGGQVQLVDTTERIPLNAETLQFVEVPYLLFTRKIEG
jgi:hypothetical protein